MGHPHEITPLTAGNIAPDFTLTDALSGARIRLHDWLGQIVVLDFWSVECPWSQRYDAYFAVLITPEMAAQGVRLALINSNAHETVEQIQAAARERGLPGPVLHDAGNQVADAYGALTTPHVFVVERDGRIVYQGAVDDRNFRQPEARVHYLDDALQAILTGERPTVSNTPTYGCTIVRVFENS
jgi:peroxiredoxin